MPLSVGIRFALMSLMTPNPTEPNETSVTALLAMRRRLLAIAATSSLLAVSYACGGSEGEPTITTGGAGGTVSLNQQNPASSGGNESGKITTLAGGGGPANIQGDDFCKTGQSPALTSKLVIERPQDNIRCPSPCSYREETIGKENVFRASCDCSTVVLTTLEQRDSLCKKELFHPRVENGLDIACRDKDDRQGYARCFNPIGEGRPFLHADVRLIAAIVTRRDWGAA